MICFIDSIIFSISIMRSSNDWSLIPSGLMIVVITAESFPLEITLIGTFNLAGPRRVINDPHPSLLFIASGIIFGGIFKIVSNVSAVLRFTENVIVREWISMVWYLINY